MASEEVTRTVRLFGRTVFEHKTVVETDLSDVEVLELDGERSFGFDVVGGD